MTAADLTPEQRAKLLAALRRQRTHLTELRERMKVVGWDRSEGFCRQVWRAADALNLAIHELVQSYRPD